MTNAALRATNHEVLLVVKKDAFVATQVYLDQHSDILDAFDHVHDVEVFVH